MSSKVRNLISKSRGGNYEAGTKAAMSDQANAQQLEELSMSPHAETRIAVAGNPNAAEETLIRLSYDPDIRVSAAIAARDDIPEDIINRLVLRAVSDYTALMGRERAHVLDLAVALANNAAFSVKDVEKLLKDIPTSHLPRLIAQNTGRIELQQFFANHPKMTVRMECLDNENIDKDVLAQLTEDENPNVADKAYDLFQQRYSEDIESEKLDLINEHKRFAASLINCLDKYKEGCGLSNGVFAENIPTTGNILVIGCQNGAIASLAAKGEATVTAIDVSEDMLNAAKELYSDHKNIIWQIFDQSEPLPFERNLFDGIIIDEFLQFYQSPVIMLPDILKLLKNNGVFTGRFLCFNPDCDYAEDFIAISEENGFSFEDCYEANMHVATSGLVIERLGEFHPVPGIFNKTLLPKEDNIWNNLVNNLAKGDENMENNVLGYFEVKGRKVDIK